AEDGLHNADVLEGMGMSSSFISLWRSYWVESLRSGVVAADQDARLAAFSKSVRQVIQIAILATGAVLVLDFRATGGIMIAGSILGGRALAPIETAISIWKTIASVRLARERINRLLEHAPKREEGMNLPAPRGALQVQRASYVIAAKRKVILSNISFEL